MASTAEKIRYLLGVNSKRVVDLQREADIPRTNIDNLIYGRSKSYEALKPIAEYFDVSVDYFLSDCAVEDVNLSPLSSKHKDYHTAFNAKLYSECLALTQQLFEKNDIQITKQMLDEYTDNIYDYALKEGKMSKTVQGFAEGMIIANLRAGSIK